MKLRHCDDYSPCLKREAFRDEGLDVCHLVASMKMGVLFLYLSLTWMFPAINSVPDTDCSNCTLITTIAPTLLTSKSIPFSSISLTPNYSRWLLTVLPNLSSTMVRIPLHQLSKLQVCLLLKPHSSILRAPSTCESFQLFLLDS
jgi:hypothetical protein